MDHQAPAIFKRNNIQTQLQSFAMQFSQRQFFFISISSVQSHNGAQQKKKRNFPHIFNKKLARNYKLLLWVCTANMQLAHHIVAAHNNFSNIVMICLSQIQCTALRSVRSLSPIRIQFLTKLLFFLRTNSYTDTQKVMTLTFRHSNSVEPQLLNTNDVHCCRHWFSCHLNSGHILFIYSFRTD